MLMQRSVVRFLHESDLIKKNQSVVSLDGADLTGSELSFANLEGSDLNGAVLTGSDLSFANLEGSDLSGANLRAADFYEANLRDANLRLSVLDDEQLMEARDLIGATMPDGTEMTEVRWKVSKAPQL